MSDAIIVMELVSMGKTGIRGQIPESVLQNPRACTYRLVADAIRNYDMIRRIKVAVQAVGGQVELTNLTELCATLTPVKPSAFAGTLRPPIITDGSGWYTALQRHMLSTDTPDHCLVLVGPPGVGKTLALERLAEQLGERCMYVFAGDIDDAVQAELLFQFVAQIADEKHRVLLLDDVDALAPNWRRTVLAAMGKKSAVHRVMVCNDISGVGMSDVRRTPAAFEIRYLKPVSEHDLLGHLTRTYPALVEPSGTREPSVIEKIAIGARGDIRAAQLEAEMQLLNRTRATNHCDNDTFGSLHIAVLKCAKESKVIPACHRLMGTRSDDALTVMAVNYPRYADDKVNKERALQALAHIAEWQSLADSYRMGMTEAEQADKFGDMAHGECDAMLKEEVMFDMGVVAPTLIVKQLAPRGAQEPRLEFPDAQLYRRTQETAAMWRDVLLRHDLSVRLNASDRQERMEQGLDPGKTGLQLASILLAQIDGNTMQERARSRKSLTGSKNSDFEHISDVIHWLVTPRQLDELLERKTLAYDCAQLLAEYGFEAAEFARAMMLRLGERARVKNVKEEELRVAFLTANPRLMYDETAAMAISGLEPAKVPRVNTAKKRKEVPGKERDQKQRTLDSMFAVRPVTMKVPV